MNEAEMKHIYVNIWLGEVWNEGNLTNLSAIFSEDFQDHRPIPQFPNTVEGHGAMAQDWCRAFPDMIFEVQDIAAENNRVFARYIARGTHQGPLLGIEATGAKVTLTGIDILGFRDGKVTDWWHEEDFDSFMKPILAADAKRRHVENKGTTNI